MQIKQLRELVVKPSLIAIDRWSQAAENLLVGIILAESGGMYLRQIAGPALGIYQCEPKTYQSIIDWLKKSIRREFYNACLGACYYEIPPPFETIVYNLRWATIICRVHFLRNDVELPAAEDIQGLAKYWKQFYNTMKGAGDPVKFESLYRKYDEQSEEG